MTAGDEGYTAGSVSTKQARLKELAQQMPDTALRSVSHHIDTVWLHEAYRQTRKDGATGIDGVTAEEYAENLEGNLEALLDQAKSGAYRAPPVRRVEIPKGKGKTRPIGIPTFEDKVLQRAVVMAMQPIYEEDFYNFSYGFRPGRSAHDALEALNRTLFKMKGGWVLVARRSTGADPRSKAPRALPVLRHQRQLQLHKPLCLRGQTPMAEVVEPALATKPDGLGEIQPTARP